MPSRSSDPSRSHPPAVQPGPIGLGRQATSSRWHPPLAAPAQEESWHPPLLLPSRYTDAERSAGESDLAMLRAVYGNVLNQSAKLAYAYYSDHGWKYRVEEYLDDRAAFFGSAEAYRGYAQTARTELDADGEKLRGYLDPATQSRPAMPHWRDAQVIFYAWTRRAYENELGAGVSIPYFIQAGMSERLRAALKQVQADYGKGFNPQGFNPRPIKATGGYRLGTLSDHALGTAVDIRPNTNAQIEASEWQEILAYTGKTLDVATRRNRWSTAPRELFAAIQEINDAFVTKLRDAVAAELVTEKTDGAALAKVVKADAHLGKLNRFIGRWRNGFFDLPWELVDALHESKFVWGATFGRLDLHHFELPPP
jgi:hypothetical protein